MFLGSEVKVGERMQFVLAEKDRTCVLKRHLTEITSLTRLPKKASDAQTEPGCELWSPDELIQAEMTFVTNHRLCIYVRLLKEI